MMNQQQLTAYTQLINTCKHVFTFLIDQQNQVITNDGYRYYLSRLIPPNSRERELFIAGDPSNQVPQNLCGYLINQFGDRIFNGSINMTEYAQAVAMYLNAYYTQNAATINNAIAQLQQQQQQVYNNNNGGWGNFNTTNTFGMNNMNNMNIGGGGWGQNPMNNVNWGMNVNPMGQGATATTGSLFNGSDVDVHYPQPQQQQYQQYQQQATNQQAQSNMPNMGIMETPSFDLNKTTADVFSSVGFTESVKISPDKITLLKQDACVLTSADVQIYPEQNTTVGPVLAVGGLKDPIIEGKLNDIIIKICDQFEDLFPNVVKRKYAFNLRYNQLKVLKVPTETMADIAARIKQLCFEYKETPGDIEFLSKLVKSYELLPKKQYDVVDKFFGTYIRDVVLKKKCRAPSDPYTTINLDSMEDIVSFVKNPNSIFPDADEKLLLLKIPEWYEIVSTYIHRAFAFLLHNTPFINGKEEKENIFKCDDIPYSDDDINKYEVVADVENVDDYLDYALSKVAVVNIPYTTCLTNLYSDDKDGGNVEIDATTQTTSNDCRAIFLSTLSRLKVDNALIEDDKNKRQVNDFESIDSIYSVKQNGQLRVYKAYYCADAANNGLLLRAISK